MSPSHGGDVGLAISGAQSKSAAPSFTARVRGHLWGPHMKLKALFGAAFAVAALSLTGCGSAGSCSVKEGEEGTVISCDDGSMTVIRDGVDGAPGQNGAAAVVKTIEVAPGTDCATGGTRVLTGHDLDGDQALGDDEIATDTLICNGANGANGKDGADGRDGVDGQDGADGQDGVDGLNGADGQDGLSALVEVDTEAAGENCPHGGLKLTVGVDKNRNGTLEADSDPVGNEVTSVAFVCNGAPGADGQDGQDGADGQDGQDGRDGVDGFTMLVETAAEPAGSHCASGGIKLITGVDKNRNGSLDEDADPELNEITSVEYICNGAAGLDGADGADGLDSLIESAIEPAGANCVDGGLKVTTGLDKNRNGVLDADGNPEVNEVASTRYLCNDSLVVFVDDDNTGDIEDGTSAYPYKTIQAAIDAAPSGGLVYVRAGTYSAGFSIENRTRLTVRGEGDGTLIAPDAAIGSGIGHKSTPNDYRAVIFVNGSNGITLESMKVTTGSLAWSTDLDAIVFWNASSGTLRNLDIDGSAAALTGAQTGQGLAVDAGTGSRTTLTVIESDFRNWNKNAIDIVNGNGDTSAGGEITVHVKGGTFTTVATGVLAQNGILYWARGAGTVTGTVDGVTLAGLDYTGAAPTEATGIISYGTANLTAVRNSDFGTIQQYLACESIHGIDATVNNTFDGVVGSSATSEELEAINGRIWDGEDNPELGLVTLQ